MRDTDAHVRLAARGDLAEKLVLGLAVVLLGDGVFDAVADDWVRADLEHLGFPTRLRRIFPVIKLASATGLVAGLARPRLGGSPRQR